MCNHIYRKVSRFCIHADCIWTCAHLQRSIILVLENQKLSCTEQMLHWTWACYLGQGHCWIPQVTFVLRSFSWPQTFFLLQCERLTDQSVGTLEPQDEGLCSIFDAQVSFVRFCWRNQAEVQCNIISNHTSGPAGHLWCFHAACHLVMNTVNTGHK